MHVLVTRAQDDSGDLMAALAAMGCAVSAAPLMRIEFDAIDAHVLDGASGIAVTSRNGLKALTKSPALAQARGLPLFAVGPATAALAGELGFAQVIAGAGKAADLIALITRPAAMHAGPIVHFCGNHLAFDLAGAAAQAGVAVRAVPVYRAVAVKTLPDGVAHRLRQGLIDAVILMSPRTARTWVEAVHATGDGMAIMARLRHLCLSSQVAEAVAEAAAEQFGPKVEDHLKFDVADRPNTEEILALMRRLVEHSRQS